MRAITLILIALSTSLSVGIANADEARDLEVVVVTAPRLDAMATQQEMATNKPMTAIDFSTLSIEAPQLDQPDVDVVPARLDIALETEIETKI